MLYLPMCTWSLDWSSAWAPCCPTVCVLEFVTARRLASIERLSRYSSSFSWSYIPCSSQVSLRRAHPILCPRQCVHCYRDQRSSSPDCAWGIPREIACNVHVCLDRVSDIRGCGLVTGAQFNPFA